jgi:hypothetical protein
MQTEIVVEENLILLEDVYAAILEGRSLRPAHHYRIVILDEQLNERHLNITDPIPTGRQILHAAKIQDVDDYSVYAFLSSGDFEEVSLNEPFDLRGRGAERFVLFKTDRAFKFVLNDRHLEWGRNFITGRVLKLLARVNPDEYGVWLKAYGCEDQLIDDNEIIDLAKPGVEKFCTNRLTITIFVNTKKKEIKQIELSFRELVLLAFPTAVFSDTKAYTLTFKHGYGDRPEGSLIDGQVIHLKNGEVFNVTATDKS